jgi:hypothetical protein
MPYKSDISVIFDMSDIKMLAVIKRNRGTHQKNIRNEQNIMDFTYSNFIRL